MSRSLLAVVTSVATLALLVAATATSRSQALFSALPTEVVAPPNSPAPSEKVAPGRLHFWNPILSGQKDVSGATCHH
jgi:cytochrome c peroxidase